MKADAVDLLSLDHYTSGADHEIFRRLRDGDPVHVNRGPDGEPSQPLILTGSR